MRTPKSKKRDWWWLPFVFGGLCGFSALSMWEALAPAAVAQTPKRPKPTLIGTFDAGKQREQMVRALEASNKKLGEIQEVLESLRELHQKQFKQ